MNQTLLLLIVLIAGAFGWFKNCLFLSLQDWEPGYQTEIIRTVGLVPVVGAVTGYLQFPGEPDIKDNIFNWRVEWD